tara:strand:- start:15 stop:380 length:366 start_codon:yes stop_codon:yes gene_type:complete
MPKRTDDIDIKKNIEALEEKNREFIKLYTEVQELFDQNFANTPKLNNLFGGSSEEDKTLDNLIYIMYDNIKENNDAFTELNDPQELLENRKLHMKTYVDLRRQIDEFKAGLKSLQGPGHGQ